MLGNAGTQRGGERLHREAAAEVSLTTPRLNNLPNPQKSTEIEHLSPALLAPEILESAIYPRIEQTHYWSDSWDPDLYVAIARAGFICISIIHPDLGAVLIPELQQSYTVLDWKNLHCSRHLRRLMASGRLEELGVELRVADPGDRVLDRLLDYHGERGWIHEPYQALVRELAHSSGSDFAMHGMELWSKTRNELIAGELGYSIGAVYTSLSGFCAREYPEWNHFGTLQQVLLAQSLQERGFHFWNMGDVTLPYKMALGACIVPRAEFLDRWCAARDATPDSPLHNGDLLRDYAASNTDICREDS